MRIILTGSNGFLGQTLTDKLVQRPDVTLLATSKRRNRNPNLEDGAFAPCDLESFEAFDELAKKFKPTHVIHTAAISSVEACEKNPETCELTNVLFVKKLAEFCKAHQVHLTFLSTDFVFDGKDGPYAETDLPNPCNAYGASKWRAEQAIDTVGCQAAILRTILVYGVSKDPGRTNLVLWVHNKLSNNEVISAVQDQWRMPTWVENLADACLLAASKNARGTYHISSDTMYSIVEVARLVADCWSLDKSLIQPIAAKDIGQAENRPRKTGFIIDKARKELEFSPTSLVDSLLEIKKQLALENTHG